MRRELNVPRSRRKTVCLVASQGGHLQQMLRLQPVYSRRPHFLVTTGDIRRTAVRHGVSRQWHIADINEGRGARNPLLLIIAFIQTARIFLRERPAAVLSTGSGIAVPAIMISWLFRIPFIYVESFARIKDLSKTGKVAYRFASAVFVQHEPLVAQYPGVRYAGSIYEGM